MSYKNHKNSPPELLDDKNDDVRLEDDIDILPASYNNLLLSLYDFASRPSESSTASFTSGQFSQDEESDKPNTIYVKSVLKIPQARTKVAVHIIRITLQQITRFCDELETTILRFIANGLANSENQFNIEVIMLGVDAAKSALDDLQRSLTIYAANVSEATHLGRKINGLGLEDLLNYTVSVMTSVRGAWIDWNLVSSRSHHA